MVCTDFCFEHLVYKSADYDNVKMCARIVKWMLRKESFYTCFDVYMDLW